MARHEMATKTNYSPCGFIDGNLTDPIMIDSKDLIDGIDSKGLMNFLEKEYGSNLTTRSWGTVLKLLK